MIGASPPQSPIMANSKPSSPKTVSHQSPLRSTHRPYSTVHTPLHLSPLTSPRISGTSSPSRIRSTSNQNYPLSSSPLSPRGATPDPTNRPDMNLPTTLFSMLTSILLTKDASLLDTPDSPMSNWSFLFDPDYVHPLLSQPLPTSCQSIASSTGLLLKTAGLKVTAIKIDPYMNIDAGTMAPTEHGESRLENHLRRGCLEAASG